MLYIDPIGNNGVKNASSFFKAWICLFDAWKKFQTYSSKWWFFGMLIYHGIESVKNQQTNPRKVGIFTMDAAQWQGDHVQPIVGSMSWWHKFQWLKMSSTKLLFQHESHLAGWCHLVREMCHSLLICTMEIVNRTFKPYQRITGSLADPVILWPKSKCSFLVKPQLHYLEFCVYHVMLFDILDVMSVKWRSWTTCPISWTFVQQSPQKTPNRKNTSQSLQFCWRGCSSSISKVLT